MKLEKYLLAPATSAGGDGGEGKVTVLLPSPRAVGRRQAGVILALVAMLCLVAVQLFVVVAPFEDRLMGEAVKHQAASFQRRDAVSTSSASSTSDLSPPESTAAAQTAAAAGAEGEEAAAEAADGSKPRNPFFNPYRNMQACMAHYSKPGKNGRVSVGNLKHSNAPMQPTCSRSRSLNAVYVHIPRSASSPIRGTLMEHFRKVDFSACKDMRLDPAQPPPYAFTFVREPLDRAHSAFVESIRRLPMEATTRVTPELVASHIDAWISDLEKGSLQRAMWQHVVPQSFYLTAPGVLDRVGTIAFIGQVEALDAHFSLLLQSLGAAPHPPEGGRRCCSTPRARQVDRLVKQALAHPERASRLCDVYSQDYVCLGYPLPQVCKDARKGRGGGSKGKGKGGSGKPPAPASAAAGGAAAQRKGGVGGRDEESREAARKRFWAIRKRQQAARAKEKAAAAAAEQGKGGASPAAAEQGKGGGASPAAAEQGKGGGASPAAAEQPKEGPPAAELGKGGGGGSGGAATPAAERETAGGGGGAGGAVERSSGNGSPIDKQKGGGSGAQQQQQQPAAGDKQGTSAGGAGAGNDKGAAAKMSGASAGRGAPRVSAKPPSGKGSTAGSKPRSAGGSGGVGAGNGGGKTQVARS